jgi:hypothetical protein
MFGGFQNRAILKKSSGLVQFLRILDKVFKRFSVCFISMSIKVPSLILQVFSQAIEKPLIYKIGFVEIALLKK